MKDTRISKASILHACTIKQQLTISDFEKEIQTLRSGITSREETASQGQNEGPERNEMLVRMEHELVFLKSELNFLETINPEKISQEVETGAVVVTDQRIFFISTSIELVEVNGQSIFGISTKAPIYPSLKGKKKGDSFTHAGVHYEILDVY
jgi:transcription elongation GreA/GreB family factor